MGYRVKATQTVYYGNVRHVPERKTEIFEIEKPEHFNPSAMEALDPKLKQLLAKPAPKPRTSGKPATVSTPPASVTAES